MRSWNAPAAIVALAAGLGAGAADAHAIWFAQEAGVTALIYGFGADNLDPVKRFPGFEAVAAYDAAYRPIPARLRIAGPLVLIDTDAPATLVVASLQNGTWSRMSPTAEYERKGRDEMPGAFYSERTVKYTVSIRGALAGPIPPLPGQMLQIVPVGAIPKTMGQPLTYRVLYRGKPIGGIPVVNDVVNDPDAKPRKTAADGTVTFPVRNQGLNVLEAVYKMPSEDPKKYDELELSATVSFVLEHQPE